MASLFSTTSQIAAVNTRARSGVITLPLTSANPYRQIMIKDLYGSFPLSTLTISTQLGDSFEDGTTSRILSNAYEFQALYAGSTSRWHTVGGTQMTAAYISSLRVDSLQLGSGDGWADFGPLRATAISSLLVQTGLVQAIAMSTFVISTGALTAGSVSSLSLAAGVISTIVLGANSAYINNLFVGTEDFGSVLTASSNITQSGGTTTLTGLSVNTISTNQVNSSNICNAGWFSNNGVLSNTTAGAFFQATSNTTTLGVAGILTAASNITQTGGTTTLTGLSVNTISTNQVNSSNICNAGWFSNNGVLSNTTAGAFFQATSNTTTLGVAQTATFASNITQTGGTTTLAGLSVNTISTNNITATNISTNSISTNFGFFSTISTGAIYGRHIGDGSLLTNLTVAGVTSILSTQAFYTSSISSANITSPQGYISSLTVDSLSFGFANSFMSMGDIITTSVSSIQIFTSSLLTTNLQVGNVSSLSYIAFPGLQQGYTQGIIAEQSTGTGLQELLIFRGSSASDRIRMQTTGSIVFEPGVSARVFPAVPSNVTPAMIINSSSNVGIGIATPGVTLDVAGAGRFTAVSTNTVSTNQVNSGSISNSGVISTLGLNVGSLSSINISSVALAAGSISTLVLGAQRAYITNLFVGTEDFGSVLTASSNITQTAGTTILAGLSVNTISTNNITASNISTNSMSTNFGFFSTISTGAIYGRHIGDGSLLTNLTVAGVTSILSTQAFYTSSISSANITSAQGYISSLTVDYLAIGSNYGYVNMGDIIATSLSSVSVEAQTLTTSNLKVGTVSSLSYVAFPGLQQGYTQGVISEQSTGTGLQELLIFRGSSASDRIRMQTTGSIIFEPGVGARVFPAVPSNVTPAMVINTSSNVGIGIAAPGVSLDVAGAGRFTAISTNTVSTNQVNSSNICNAGFISNNGILSNITAGAFFQNTSNTGTLGLAGILTAASNITQTSGTTTLAGLSVNTISTNQVNSSNICNAGFISNNGILSNITAGAFFQNTSNTGTLGLAGILTAASNITQTSGTTTLAGLSVNTISTNSVIVNTISSASISTINLIANNSIIPYSTLNASTYFHMRNSTTQMFFGTYGPSSQIYIGDLKAAAGNTVNTDPLLLLEQLPITSASVTQTFTYTGANQNFTVPAGVTSMNVTLNGAGGGSAANGGGTGGAGGYVSGTLPVTPGQSLVVMVGQGGGNGGTASATYGGGGNGTGGGAGGGRSAIILAGSDMVTAGGGGGGKDYINHAGGAGGGSTGGNGGGSYPAYAGGGGTTNGTNSGTGGTNGGGTSSSAGSQYQGGFGSGGGGGGYFGGGGSGATGGGGGGSSYVSLLTGTVVNTQGTGASAGQSGSITITYTPSPAYRPGNLLEFRNYQTNKFIIDPLLNVGVNVTSITSSFQLDVNGAFRATSVSTNTLTTTNFSNVGNLSNGGSATFFSNGSSAASPSTTNSYPYASFKINAASTNTLTPVTPLILMIGNYGGSIAGGLTQGVGPVLSLGTIPDVGATQEGYRLTGSNSAFYGNVDMQGNNISNINTISTNYAFISTISTGSVFGRFIGDGSLLTGLPAAGTGVTNNLSTLAFYTSSISTATIQTSNIRVGTISSQSFLAYPGLQQGYAQSIIAEQSTGTGLQELLIFRGSSASDRIRLQTTGFICFETGVGARTFPSVGSNATPSWMIDVNGCVGVGLIPSGTQNKLDVAGQGRFQSLSTTSIMAGSMNLSVAFV